MGIEAGTIQENVHIDLLQWGGPEGPAAAPWSKVQDTLERCLAGSAGPGVVRLGVLTHHKAMKEDAFALLLNFVTMTRGMQSASWLVATQLFE